MVFMHDTTEALTAAAYLANTRAEAGRERNDTLASAADVDAFLAAHAYTGVVRRDAGERRELRAIRDDLHRFWMVSAEDAPAHLNRLLARGRALPQLVRHGDVGWHVHAVDGDAPLATRVLVETAMAAIDVIRSDEWSRLRVCDADDCNNVLVDLSRNRSKRYCDAGGCGNRLHVSAYRARRAAGPIRGDG